MYQLEETTYLYILILLPIILLVFLYNKYWQKITIKKYFDDATFNFLSPELSSTKSYIKTSLTLLIISILVFGLVNPKIGTELKTVKREGVDIVFAIDVSKSMLVEDVATSRLLKSIQIISQFKSKICYHS